MEESYLIRSHLTYDTYIEEWTEPYMAEARKLHFRGLGYEAYSVHRKVHVKKGLHISVRDLRPLEDYSHE